MSSLKCWLRKINKQDKISKEELNEIFNRLDGHDKAIRTDEREKTIDELESRLLGNCSAVYKDGCRVIVIEMDIFEFIVNQMKGGAE